MKDHAPGRDTDVVLVGCVKTKATTAGPARDLYQSPLFHRRRAYAERTGRPWYVVSARWGLVGFREEIAPYDLHLGDVPVSFQRAWADFVIARLALHGQLTGSRVEIHAGADYADVLRPALEEQGAVVRTPVRAGSPEQVLAWYGQHAPPPAQDPVPRSGSQTASQVAAALSDRSAALTPAELRAGDRAALSAPGLYSWWVDARAPAT